MKHLIIPSIFVPIALVLLIGISTANAQRTPALARYRASAVQVNDPSAPQSGYDLSWCTIDGGGTNAACGYAVTVPGGSHNTGLGAYSFAIYLSSTFRSIRST